MNHCSSCDLLACHLKSPSNTHSSTFSPQMQALSGPRLLRRPSTQARRGLSCKVTASLQRAVPLNPPYNVLITGSTKGVGRALAEGFLKEGDTVIITSRSSERVAQTVEELGQKYGKDKVKGLPCNVSKPQEVQALADYAKAQCGTVDIWINNAGTNGYSFEPLISADTQELSEIVTTNVLGSLLCCKEAIRIMKDQPGGHIFNMDGAGSDGLPTPNLAAYGATKRSLAQLGGSLVAELTQANIKHVCVHQLSPGMVITELLMPGAKTPQGKFFINVLAEEAQDAAAYLVPRIRKVPQESINPLTGAIKPASIKFLTWSKALVQVAQRLATGARKDRFVPE